MSPETAASMPRHCNNLGRAALTVESFRANKNPHAVALGHMTSAKKAAAAKSNGKQGGRPEGS